MRHHPSIDLVGLAYQAIFEFESTCRNKEEVSSFLFYSCLILISRGFFLFAYKCSIVRNKRRLCSGVQSGFFRSPFSGEQHMSILNPED